MQTTDNCLHVTNERDFDNTLKTHPKLYALIYATWCPYCLRFLPSFQKAAREESNLFLLAQDDQERLADRYDVEVIPTVLVFEDGQLAKRLDGVLGVGLNEKLLTDFIHR